MTQATGPVTAERPSVLNADFVQWWALVEPDLLRMAVALGLRENARDIVQDVAVLALRNRERLIDFSEFQKWTRARLYWLSLDEWGRRAKSGTDLEKVIATVGVQPMQEDLAINAELRRYIEGLPLRQRDAMKRSLEGESVADIARDLKIERTTVRSLLRFARRALFRQLVLGEKQ